MFIHETTRCTLLNEAHTHTIVWMVFAHIMLSEWSQSQKLDFIHKKYKQVKLIDRSEV